MFLYNKIKLTKRVGVVELVGVNSRKGCWLLGGNYPSRNMFSQTHVTKTARNITNTTQGAQSNINITTKRNFYSAHHETNAVAYIKKNKKTDNLLENSKNVENIEIPENNIKVYALKNISSHPQIITDFVKNNPELFTARVTKIGLTHKVLDKALLKKYDFPDILSTAYAGLEHNGKPQRFVLWDAETTVENITKIKENSQITARFKAYYENVEKVNRLEAMGREHLRKKEANTMSEEKLAKELELEKKLVKDFRKKIKEYYPSANKEENDEDN